MNVDSCPYHYLKSVANKAQLLLCPYNYVTDPLIRKFMGLSLKDSIIVFDEAHNLETVCEQSCS